MPTSTRQPICVLGADLASQIAAGEVVERPSSVVKELIENALDAGARRVDVKIEGGGLTLIEVADDGSGMHPDDAALSLARHATSKLTAFSDLDDLASYGFRGEALPSIASVSRLEITTRYLDEESGLSIVAAGTTMPQIAPCGHPVGTTISVRDLFFNVPARRKFLRSTNTESGHVAEVVVDAALSRPEVSFFLHRDGKTVRKFERVASLAQRVEQVTEEDQLLIIEDQRGPVTIEAFLAPAERGRRGAQGLKLVVNGRPIRDRSLAATVAHAFGPSLEKGRYPRGVVYLTLPRRLVDINVHPQKTEVRFVDARAVCDALYSVVAKGLHGGALRQSAVPKSAAPKSAVQHPVALVSAGSEGVQAGGEQVGAAQSRSAQSSAAQSRSAQSSAAQSSAAQSSAAQSSAAQSKVSRSDAHSVSAVAVEGEAAPISGQRYTAQPGTSHAASKTWLAPSARGARPEIADLNAARQTVQQAFRSAERSPKALRFLGQAQDSYLVCSHAEGIVILDQHAADELSIFVRLSQAYRAGGLQSQSLLFPSTLALNKRETALIVQHSALLLRLGLDLRVRAEGMVSLHAIMGLLKRATAEELVCAFVTAAQAERDDAKLVERFFASVACREAVPHGTTLGLGDAQAILKGLSSVELEQGHAACVHGQPVLSTTSFAELGRKADR